MQSELRVVLSFLDSAEDRKPVLYELKWLGFVNLLSQSEERTTKDGKAFVPAEFGEREYTGRDGSIYKAMLRKKSSVEHVSMAVLDYDSGVTPKQAARHFRGFEHVIYTTHSHRKVKPKFRVVLPLAEPIPADLWVSAWLHLRDFACIDGHAIDLACSDASRLYYLPSHPSGIKSLFRHNEGELLTLPDSEHPELVRAASRNWLASLKIKSSAPDVSLGEWLVDKGVECRPKSGASEVYQLPECPWGSEHASGTDGWGHAAVLVRDEKWAFACCHDTCISNGRGWADFRETVSPKPAFEPRKEFKLAFGRSNVRKAKAGNAKEE